MRSRSRAGLWRHRGFLLFWGSQTVSQVGSQVSLLALPLVAILTLEASPFQVALLTALEWVPWLVVALPAGVWIDRLRRKPILVAGDLGRALALGSIPLAYALNGLTIWQLYAVAVVTGVLTVCFDVAYPSYLPSLVARDRLVDGNAKLELSRSAAQVAGPGLGGGLVTLAGAPFAILLDSVSFLVSAVLLRAIRTAEPAPARPAERSMRGELMEGLRYLFGHRYWRSLALWATTFNLTNNIAGSVTIVFAVRELELSAAQIGLVLSLAAAVSIVGAVLAPRIPARFGVGPTMTAAGAFSGIPLLLVPLATPATAIPMLVAAFGLCGGAIIVFNVAAISLMQALTPERLLGRFNASRRFLVFGAVPVGAVIGGALASVIGLRPTIFVGAILCSLCVVFVAFSPVRRVRDLPEAPEPDPVSWGAAPVIAALTVDA